MSKFDGNRVRVIDRKCGHGFTLGDIVTLGKATGSEDWHATRDDGEQWYLRREEFEPVATTFEAALDCTLDEVRKVMIDRHRKYGPGNILRHGEYGVVVRLGDKYERLDHSREIDFADESADDTADDIIGYGLIFKMLRAGQWPGQKHPASPG